MPVPEALAIMNTTLSSTVAAVKALQYTYSLVQDIRNAPEQIKQLTADVQGLSQVLGLLQTALEEDNVANDRLPAQTIQILEVLRGRCTELSSRIGSILKPFLGQDGTPRGGTWRNLRWGVLKKHDAEDLQRTLETSKSTIDLAVSSLNLYAPR